MALKKHINKQEKIKLPLNFNPVNDNFRQTETYFRTSQGFIDGMKITNDIVKIELHESVEKIEWRDIPKINIIIVTSNGERREFEFGSCCVKESMAYMIQKLIDVDVSTDYTIPYNSIEIISNHIAPEIGTDRKKLICLCAIALMGQFPGKTFLETLNEARKYPKLTGLELYYLLMKKWQIDDIPNERRISTSDYLEFSIAKFENKLSTMIVADLELFNTVITKIRANVKSEISPLLELIYQENITSEDIWGLKSKYGTPCIEDMTGQFYFLKPKDIGELVAQEAVINKLTNPDKTCMLVKFCTLDELDDKFCDTKPWKRERLCSFRVISDFCNLGIKLD